MCIPNFFQGIFSNRSETASSYDVAQSNRQQAELMQQSSQSQQQQRDSTSAPSTTRRSKSSTNNVNNNNNFQQKLQPQLPQQQTIVTEEKDCFNGLFYNKKKVIQKRTTHRSKPSGAQQHQKKKYSFGNNNNINKNNGEFHQNRNNMNKTKAAEKEKMKKQTPSMQHELNQGGYKAHALMNQPPPLNANPARKSKQKVENTISISVHQPVDSDSDADLLNTDKKRNSVPQRKKQEGHGKEMPKRFTAQITQPILPSNQNNNGGGTDGINDSTRGGAAVNGVKRSKSSNYINDEQKNKQENMNVEKTAETIPFASPQSSPLQINSQAEDTDTDVTPQPTPLLKSDGKEKDNETEGANTE